MKYISLIFIFSFLFLDILAQKPTIYISGTYNNLSFEEFAAEIKTRHDISLFFKSEWVNKLKIDCRGDAIDLDSLLSVVLNGSGNNYYIRNSRQVFLTGKLDINEHKLLTKTTANIDSNKIEEKDSRINNQISYDKRAHSVVIGKESERSASARSTLTGQIVSINSGEPVIGATVYIEGTNLGVISNSDGFFILNIPTATDLKLKVSCMGMEPESYHLIAYNSGSLNIELKEKLIDIQEVLVKSNRMDNIRGIQMGYQRLAVKEISAIPVALGESDILKVANLLPGVQTVGEGSTGFNVRGSSGDQNLFLVNDIPVLNTGHLFGFFSAFSPDIVTDFNLYKSNFPVEYGGRLASIFEVTTRKGNKKKFGARGGISPVTGSLLLETPIIKDKASLVISGRSTYSDWILSKLDDIDIRNSNASFGDLMAGIHIIPDNKSSLQIFGYFSLDKFTLSNTQDYEYSNRGSSINYSRQLGDSWKMDISAVTSEYSNKQSNYEFASGAFKQSFDVSHYELKSRLRGFGFKNHRFTLGANFILHKIDQGELLPFNSESYISPLDLGTENGIEYSVFASDEYNITENLTLYGGIRFSSFNYLGENTIYSYNPDLEYKIENITDTSNYSKGENIINYMGPELRFSLNYLIRPELSVKMSYNRMRQYLFMLSNTIAISPTDRWKLADPHISPPVSDQFSLGLYKNVASIALETSVELYYKKSKNIIDYKDGADLRTNPYFETSILQGNQNSWGAEFLLKRNSGRLTGWISYTYSHSSIIVDSENSWEQINNGIEYPSNYDKPHAINFVANYRISRRVSLGSNIVYSSGRPITYPVGIYTINDVQSIVYSRRNEFRIPDYFRIDLALNIEGNLVKNKPIHGSWMIAVYNLSGRKNAYSIYFKNEGGKIKGYKQSIYGVPIITLGYNFKLGNYAVE